MSADFLEHFSLLEYAIVAAIYTLLVFTSIGLKTTMIFSNRNVVPTSKILNEHFKFLTILLVLMWAVTLLYPNLPEWSKEIWTARGRSSDVDLAFILTAATMCVVEHHRIYAEAETERESNQ